ncbi:MAG: hypothetical protein ACRDJ5_03640 [Actinomycetota bacterium]
MARRTERFGDPARLARLDKRQQEELKALLKGRHWIELGGRERKAFDRMTERHARERRQAWGRDPMWADKLPARAFAERAAKAAVA